MQWRVKQRGTESTRLIVKSDHNTWTLICTIELNNNNKKTLTRWLFDRNNYKTSKWGKFWKLRATLPFQLCRNTKLPSTRPITQTGKSDTWKMWFCPTTVSISTRLQPQGSSVWNETRSEHTSCDVKSTALGHNLQTNKQDKIHLVF